MNHRRIWFFVLAAIALSTTLWRPVAHADVRTEARRAFRHGMELIQEGQVDEGVASLQEAYDILPHPNVLYNIGRAYAEAGRYDEAVEYFERYLAADPPDREEVQGFLGALQDRIAARERAAQPAAETVTQEVAPTPAALGAHFSSAQIQAIEDSATQIAALAEATESDGLRRRAERLHQLALSLQEREQRAIAAAAAAAEADAGTGADAGVADSAVPTEVDAGSASGSGADVEPDAGDGESLDLGSERTGGLYEESVVSASRMAESPLDAPNSTTIVTSQDIHLSGLVSIPELLRRAAGVDVMTMGPGETDVSIRGLNQRESNKVLVLIDGRSVRQDFLGAPYWAAALISVEDIERIEIIRGPASAVYGADAFSGIINIITRHPGEEDSYVTVGAGNDNVVHAAGGVSGHEGGFGYRLSAGYDQADRYALESSPDRADLTTFPQVPNRDLQMRRFTSDMSYRFGEGYEARGGLAAAQGRGGLYGVGPLRQLQNTNVLFTQSFLGLTTPSGVSVRTFWNHFETDVDSSGSPRGAIPITTNNLVGEVIDAQVDFARTFHLLVDQSFSMGVEYRYKSIQWSWLEGDKFEHHFGAYIQDVLQLHEKLRLTLSLRADRHPLLSGLQVSPRGSLVWRVAEGQSLRITGGSAFRSPNFLESYLVFENQTPVRAATALGVGNTNLDPERMISFELGYSNQATDFFALEANAYVNRVDNLTFLSSVSNYTLGQFGSGERGWIDSVDAIPFGQTQFENDATVYRQIGGELGVRLFPVTGLDIYANYAYSDTSPIAHADQLDEARRRERRTSAHKINAGVQYRSHFGLDVSADFSWVSRQRWAEQTLDVANLNLKFDSLPLGAYAILNARVGYRFLDDALELSVVGTNLLSSGRQHPYGQPIDTRVMGVGAVHF
ncbi:MAG: TonB-dependent receptor [Deltaproteobacteria bacterium]|nr:TonB-dependent receptor [Deltaproteobacteria bacterium]